jgi:hypothetical protein
MSIGDNGNKWAWHKTKRPLNEWIRVRLTQSELGGKTMFRVYENDEMQFELENTKSQVFKDVKIFAGDPWHAIQEGFIRNLRIFNAIAKTA